MNNTDASQLIPDLNHDLIERKRRYLHNMVVMRKHKVLPEFLWRDLPVYHFGDISNGYYVQYNAANNDVTYFVAYRLIKGGGLRFGRQIFVWSEFGNFNSAGLARHVFWKLLMPRYKALISDTQQTKAGQAFWRNRLAEALDQDKFCYLYDKRKGTSVLLRLQTNEDVNKHKNDIWGVERNKQKTYAVISSVPLKLNPTKVV